MTAPITPSPLDPTSMSELSQFLEHMRDAQRGCHAPLGRYVGMEDFVLQRGIAFTLFLPKPASISWGTPRRCFDNAFCLASELPELLTYVEGYASGIIPVHHAWVIDYKGRVIDPTWRDVGTAYRGVAFQIDYARRMYERNGCVLDNWHDHWPLLRGEHSLEEALHPDFHSLAFGTALPHS